MTGKPLLHVVGKQALRPYAIQVERGADGVALRLSCDRQIFTFLVPACTAFDLAADLLESAVDLLDTADEGDRPALRLVAKGGNPVAEQ